MYDINNDPEALAPPSIVDYVKEQESDNIQSNVKIETVQDNLTIPLEVVNEATSSMYIKFMFPKIYQHLICLLFVVFQKQTELLQLQFNIDMRFFLVL